MAAGHSRKCLLKEMQKMADEGDIVACHQSLLTEWCPLISMVYYILKELQQGTEADRCPWVSAQKIKQLLKLSGVSPSGV